MVSFGNSLWIFRFPPSLIQPVLYIVHVHWHQWYRVFDSHYQMHIRLTHNRSKRFHISVETTFSYQCGNKFIIRVHFSTYIYTYIWYTHTEYSKLTFIERCGSQADLSFTWCLQVSIIPLTVRWFLSETPWGISAFLGTNSASNIKRLCNGEYRPGQLHTIQSSSPKYHWCRCTCTMYKTGCIKDGGKRKFLKEFPKETIELSEE
jgi:hypothetical protein